MQLIMVGVPSKDVGLTALERIDDAVAEGTITVDDAALVYRNEKGKVKIHQTRDATAKRGALRGGAVGLLVGLIAAPVVAATAVGVGAGALIGKARDSGVSDKLMKQIGTYIEGDESAVFILADDSSTLTIAAVVEELMAGGAKIDYEVIPPEAQAFLVEAIKLGAVD
ncbi:MAG TPA: DUF1269 domain-containing protein [Miltoncostaeaceae bacterium]|nr:DUF1269 domain-containing protein [Miltoncostaeaceae bacterium]